MEHIHIAINLLSTINVLPIRSEGLPKTMAASNPVLREMTHPAWRLFRRL
jgi:hypothetical protein